MFFLVLFIATDKSHSEIACENAFKHERFLRSLSRGCTSLRNLPVGIYMLKSLRTLILSGCSKIDLSEKDIVHMKSLVTLIAENTVVKQVPFSIVSSKSFGYISLRGFEGLSHNFFPSIIRSWMLPTMNPINILY